MRQARATPTVCQDTQMDVIRSRSSTLQQGLVQSHAKGIYTCTSENGLKNKLLGGSSKMVEMFEAFSLDMLEKSRIKKIMDI